MNIQPFDIVDITSRTSGILNLYSSSNNGIYEVRQYICGADTYKLLSRGDYTSMSMFLNVRNCIKIANLMNDTIYISYTWEFNGGINALLISTAILYVIFLIIVGLATCIGCAFGGKIIKYIYHKRISPLIDRDTCTVIDLDHPVRVPKPLPLPPTAPIEEIPISD